ncbi:hypothetical protein EVA_11634 [gut metagenome]|uniref:Uncharacterized protein n=1 Tax=gut metagenome TaxID=749906 RepID=J9CJL4_9ZZZZ
MYALATIIFFVTLTLLLISNFIEDSDDEAGKKQLRYKKHQN